MDVLHYWDLTGFKFFPIYDHMMRSIGVHSERGEKSAVAIKRYFGNFLIILAIIQGWASTVAALDSLKEEDYKAVTNVMSYMSITFSCLSKVQIARSHMSVMHRLGVWIIQVKKNRPKDMKQPLLEYLVLKANPSFFYFGLFAAVFWVWVPIVTLTFQAFIPTKFPYLDKYTSNSISFPVMQLPLYVFFTVAITYTATSLLHFLAVFTTEVKLLSEKWAQVVYDKRRPHAYMESMKTCVQQHIKLLDVMKDLNIIHDSMFAFQVMIFIVHFVSFNFCLVMTSGSNAISSVFPLFSSSMIEFGLLCWMGEEITDALQQFHRSIYMTNWYEASLSDKKNMIVMLEFLKKRHVLTGTKVFVASLDTYVEAAKQAFSAYTLMKALTE
uniref:Odorant receptor n=1 Tax=Adelphocoris lineolatus TaxID=236346 RepID=A0A2I4PH25_ADELI|nr:olfactory receptor 32 [Adelphocoris lineolatus]